MIGQPIFPNDRLIQLLAPYAWNEGQKDAANLAYNTGNISSTIGINHLEWTQTLMGFRSGVRA